MVNHLNILVLKISYIKYRKIKHKTISIYRELQEEREQAKAVLVEKVNTDNIHTKSSKEPLNMYMGKMRIIASKLCKSKVESDYTETDLIIEGENPDWIAASEGMQEDFVSNGHKNGREGVKGKNKEIRLRPHRTGRMAPTTTNPATTTGMHREATLWLPQIHHIYYTGRHSHPQVRHYSYTSV